MPILLCFHLVLVSELEHLCARLRLCTRSCQRPRWVEDVKALSDAGLGPTLPQVKLTMPGDSVIIVNAIHVFFPGHTWVRHCLSSNFFLTLLLCLFQPHLCKDTKIYRFWRNRNSPRSYFGCSWEVTVSDRVRPCQTVSFGIFLLSCCPAALRKDRSPWCKGWSPGWSRPAVQILQCRDC